MFRSAAVKLTLWYLAIIMALSIGCSIAIYNVSINDLSRNVYRQISFLNSLLKSGDVRDYNNLRSRLLSEDRHHLKNNLFLFNIFVLVAGGAVSYGLARRTLRPIEESLEAQSRFASDASHELRTPLTALQTENEVALRNSNLTKDQAIQLLKSNLEEVKKLKNLSEGLLRLANTDSTSSSQQIVPVKRVVKAAIGRFAKTAAAKKISFKTSLEDVNVPGDEHSLVELLATLIDNAIKYSPRGSQITITAKKHSKKALISVQDQGQGIKKVEQAHVFERFYRADISRSKSGTPGYGLGLAIAKKIAEIHQASITVRSKPGQGSTFSVELPLAT